MIDQSPDDVYPFECYVRTQLVAWAQWRCGDGVAGVGGSLGMSEERAMTIDSNRANFKPIVIVHEAERTGRAVARMRAEDERGWFALDCYHFRSEAKRACAKAAGVHHREIEAILRRAHENLYLFRREDAHRQNIVKSAPVLA